MLIRCMIKRDGVTEVPRGGKVYRFEKNEHGHAVCDIHDKGHAKMLLRMGPRYYIPYKPGSEEAAEIEDFDLDEETETSDLDDDNFEEKVPILEGSAANPQTQAPGTEGKEEPSDDDAPKGFSDQSQDEPQGEGADTDKADDKAGDEELPPADLSEEEVTILVMVKANEKAGVIGHAIGCDAMTAGRKIAALKKKLGIEAEEAKTDPAADTSDNQ